MVVRTIQRRRAGRNGDHPALVRALHDNRALWTTFAADVAIETNELPADLRGRIFYLAEFTQHYSRRVLAGCCNTPLFLEFSGGHWLSLYGLLWPASTRPAVEMRTMVSDLPDASVLPDDVPNLKTRSLRFYARLMKAWIAMGFRSPRIEVAGDTHA